MTDAPAPRRTDPLERVMHEMPYGIYIVGSVEDGEPNAMIADWVMQVSFQPRLLAVALEHDSRSLARIRQNSVFTVNLLVADQDGMTLAQRFVQPSEGAKIEGRSVEAAGRTHRKLDGVDYTTTERGCPLLDDALAWVECKAEQFVEAGDHTLVIGRVVDGAVLQSAEPMTSLFTGWTYSG